MVPSPVLRTSVAALDGLPGMYVLAMEVTSSVYNMRTHSFAILLE
jgi:hypothetical protein